MRADHLKWKMPTTLDDVVDSLGCGWGQYFLVLFAGEVLSGMLKMMMSLGVHDYTDALNYSSYERAMIFSAVFVGNALGNFCSGYLADTFGRRVAIITGNICVVCGVGPLAFMKPSSVLFVACNICGGLGLGLMGPACWTLIGEVSPAKDRTFLIGLGQISWSIGAMIVLTGLAFGVQAPSLLSMAFAIALAHTIGVSVFVVESPAYLERVGEHKKSGSSAPNSVLSK